jgi:hypothetical protein
MVDASRSRQVKPRLEIDADVEVDTVEPVDTAAVRFEPRPCGLQRPRPYPLPWLLTLGVLLASLLAGTAEATIIIMYRSPGQILVGSDGVTQSALDPRDRYASCKIHRVADRAYFATTGIRMLVVDYTAVDIAEVVRSVFFMTGFDETGVRTFNHLLGKVISRQFRQMSESDYRLTIEAMGRTVVTIATFQIRTDGIPEIGERTFKIPKHLKKGTVMVKTVTCPPCYSPTLTATYGWTAATNAANAILSSTPGLYSRSGGVAGGMRELLEAAIAADKSACGPPISILRLKSDGVEWIERGKCNDE